VDTANDPHSSVKAAFDMTIQQLVFLAATFGFVTTVSWLAFSIASQARQKRRLSSLRRDTTSGSPRSNWREQLVRWLRPVAKLSTPKEAWENSPLRVKFLHAGYRNQSAATVFLGVKSAAVLMLPTLFAIVGPNGLRAIHIAFGAIVLAAIGYYLPDFVLRKKIESRQRELLDNFPDAVDLLTVCVEAGLGLDAALNRVTEELRLKCPTLADELHLVNLELRAGGSREQALRNLALRTGLEDLNALVAMLVQAERFGTSIADSLRVYSAELRGKRKAKAEEAAAKIALKPLFPLIFCLFPALMLVIMGPAMINIYKHLVPAMSSSR
jgi:tight adherence protein C